MKILRGEGEGGIKEGEHTQNAAGKSLIHSLGNEKMVRLKPGIEANNKWRGGDLTYINIIPDGVRTFDLYPSLTIYYSSLLSLIMNNCASPPFSIAKRGCKQRLVDTCIPSCLC